MADWYGNSRSNYFKVKDEVEFREWADCLSLTVWEKDGGLPSLAYAVWAAGL